jgi:hypothetical protein
MKQTIVWGTLLLAALPAWGQSPWADEARSTAAAIPPKLLDVLKAEIDKGGPAAAIGACNEQAPKMAQAASQQTGWAIRRVSLRHRNPKAVPDAWERETLQDFDRRAAAGEPAQKLERAELVTENGRAMQRYMRALPVQELCTSCHGPAEQLDAAVTARLKALYPDDRGTGYTVGDIRGAITLKRPAP